MFENEHVQKWNYGFKGTVVKGNFTIPLFHSYNEWDVSIKVSNLVIFCLFIGRSLKMKLFWKVKENKSKMISLEMSWMKYSKRDSNWLLKSSSSILFISTLSHRQADYKPTDDRQTLAVWGSVHFSPVNCRFGVGILDVTGVRGIAIRISLWCRTESGNQEMGSWNPTPGPPTCMECTLSGVFCFSLSVLH